MKKYRKKPLVIEAIQWLGKLEDLSQLGDSPLPIVLSPLPKITIQTLEGNMICDISDWIIRGIQGELYPCKAEIFEKSYEEVKE